MAASHRDNGSTSKSVAAAESNIAVPQWKRELILRRRAIARNLPAGSSTVQFTCPPVVAAVRHPSSSSSSSQSVVDVSGESISSQPADTLGGVMRLQPESDRRSQVIMDTVKYRQMMGEEKTRPRGRPPLVLAELNGDGLSDSSEELAYGPGIVKKLKSKYMSMTLRENKQRGARPSLTNMRRATSLENIVDAEPPQETGSIVVETTAIRPRFAKRQEAVSASNGASRYRSGNRGNESIKRARSVEALLRYDGVAGETRTLPKSLSKDEIIIVEKTPPVVTPVAVTAIPATPVAVTPRGNKKRSAMNGLPPADVVKTTLKLFETRGNGPKLGVNVGLKPLPGKPLLSPKPSPEKLRRANPLAAAMAKKPASPSEAVAMDSERRAQLLSPVTVEVHELPSRVMTLDLKSVAAPTTSPSSPRQPPPISPFQRTQSPVAKQPSPVATLPSPVAQQPGPASKVPSSVAQQPGPIAKVPSPIVEQPAPVAKLPSPVAKQPSPVAQQPLPIAKIPSPVAKLPSPVAKQPPPVAKLPSPVAKQPPPVAKLPSPVAKQPAPVAKLPSPVAKQPSPVKLSSPVAKERTPSPEKRTTSPLRPVTNGNVEEESTDGCKLERAVIGAAPESGRKAVELNFKTSDAKSHLPGSKRPVDLVGSVDSKTPAPSVASVAVSKVPSVASVAVSKVPSVTSVPVSKGPSAVKIPVAAAPRLPTLPKSPPVSFPEKRAPMSPLPDLNSPDCTKQVGVIRPIVAKPPVAVEPRSTPTLAEMKKNLINSGKCEKVVASLKASEIVSGNVSDSLKNGTGLWDSAAVGKKPWHQHQTTVKYNFKDRKEVPSHVQNDGIVMPKTRTKIRPGESGYILLDPSLEESSTDCELDAADVLGGYAGPPSPCNVVFEGDNVLINGKSNLRKQPRQSKLRITFDDAAVQLFEYPSESSLLSDVVPPPPTTAPPTPSGGGSLASYTSKTSMATQDFELGVTRTTPAPRPREALPMEGAEPAAGGGVEENVAWSHTANDHLMF